MRTRKTRIKQLHTGAEYIALDDLQLRCLPIQLNRCYVFKRLLYFLTRRFPRLSQRLIPPPIIIKVLQQERGISIVVFGEAPVPGLLEVVFAAFGGVGC